MLLDKHLHIIALDVPYPADYGGAIEQFYKIVWLHRLGVKIHLHCFTKKRAQASKLNEYCETINYYPRKTGFKRFPIFTPYIVASRSEPELLANLQKDNHPILFEGIHTTFLLQTNLLKGRKIYVRLHNCEYMYYEQLAKLETKFFKRMYFRYESFLLKKFEKRIAKTYPLLAISQTDKEVFIKELNAKNVQFIPAFVGWEEVTAQTGKGCYCLYHGNLSINENEEAAEWLIKNVFNDLDVPLLIAGKSPSKKLEKLVHANEKNCIVGNPSEKELQDMIAKAQINVLPSFNNTGIKLKLLNALYSGRHCIVNKQGVDGSGLETACAIADNTADFKKQIIDLYAKPFCEEETEKRKALLAGLNNNKLNAEKIMNLYWP
jgi:hypothetical protein